MFLRGAFRKAPRSILSRRQNLRSAFRTLPHRTFSVENGENGPREKMEYDVVIVGAGPAGLGAAIRLKQLAMEKDVELDVCVVEKGATVGSHILSGNVFDPRSLNELIPDWKERDAPLTTPVTKDKFLILTENSAIDPKIVPPLMSNKGNYVISLGVLCGWLGEQAEELGVEIYPGFAAAEVLYGDSGEVRGVATGDMGVGKDGQPKDTFMRGMELTAKQTLFAEGCRGSLSEQVIKQFELRKDSRPQSYGIGLKEVWEVDESKFESGLVIHTLGYPVPRDTYAGGFLYMRNPNQIHLGLVVGLDYPNPYLSPYEELQKFKLHPSIKPFLEGGKCISYGARAINEGGYQSIPKLTFPGGALIGCSAGFVNVAKVKGSHYAMKSGMVAAEEVFKAVEENPETRGAGIEITSYESALKQTFVYSDLKEVRNFRPAFDKGFFPGLAICGMEAMITKGKLPITLNLPEGRDTDHTKKASECKPIEYPKPDNKITFDILTSLSLSGTNHEEDQPCHLQIKPDKANVPIEVSYREYASPETRFCPAKVYEIVTKEDGSEPRLQINAQNCLHCKTCSIKTPDEYINWVVPEGGGGPAYEVM